MGGNYHTTDTRLKTIEDSLDIVIAENDCTGVINAQLKRMEESIKSLILSSNTKNSTWPVATTNLNKNIMWNDNQTVVGTTSTSHSLASNSITASIPGQSILTGGTNSENRWKVVEPRKCSSQKANICRSTCNINVEMFKECRPVLMHMVIPFLCKTTGSYNQFSQMRIPVRPIRPPVSQ